MKTSKIVGLISALTMLSSVVAVPASATYVNAYSVSYETLTRTDITSSDTIIPVGAIAITMSVAGNTGFDNNTFAMEIANNYQVLTDSDGNPLVKLDEVLSGFEYASSISVTDNRICVAVASASESDINGALFTIYCTPSNAMTSKNVSEIASIVPPCTEKNNLFFQIQV